MARKTDLLPGTLDMLILRTLARAPLHGYGIALSIKNLSQDVLTVEEGSLYPALQRLLLQGWVKASGSSMVIWSSIVSLPVMRMRSEKCAFSE